MPMYIMNGETFLKKYISEDPDTVLDTQYIIVSSSIRKSGRYEKQIINANSPLYPPEMLFIDYEDYKEFEYVKAVEDVFDESLPFLATLISYAIDEESNIVFICAKREWQYRYLQILKDFILNRFEYHIYDYKKIKSGKEKIVEDDESLVSDICNKILKKAKKERDKKLLSTDMGRHKYIEDMDKIQMIKKLKKMNLYVKGMNKKEMKETLDVFL